MTIEELKSNGNIITQSQIKEHFYGFDDNMEFQLLNGQIWKQIEFNFSPHFALMPQVTIYILNNMYFININGRNEFVKVKCI